jgi:hypothetical protein
VVKRSTSFCRPCRHSSRSRQGSCLRPGTRGIWDRPARTPCRNAWIRGAATLPGMAGRPRGAGGVRGVDQALHRLGGLDGPVRVRVLLRGGSQVAQEMLGARLADQAGNGVVVLVPVMHHHRPAHVRKHERGAGLHAPVAGEVIGEQVRAGDQQVALASLRPAASPCSPADGGHSSTSPSAPARSATSPAPHSS